MNFPSNYKDRHQINNPADKHAGVRRKIINFISIRGPSLPIHISRELGLDTLFSSAFLSELLSEKLLKMSYLRIGSSPLYYVPGQENLLVRFENYIKGREKEAYNLLKKKGILRDDLLEPAIRVALRGIRDFAFPISVKSEGKQFSFWRFLLLDENEAKSRISAVLNRENIIKKEIRKPLPLQKKPLKTIKHLSKLPQRQLMEVKQKKDERKIKTSTQFSEAVKEYLRAWDIELLEEIESKKKESFMRVRINSDLDKIEFLAVCKDKKRVSDSDLMLAMQKAKSYKLPCLFILTGELTRKAENYYSVWQNLMKVKKIRFK